MPVPSVLNLIWFSYGSQDQVSSVRMERSVSVMVGFCSRKDMRL